MRYSEYLLAAVGFVIVGVLVVRAIPTEEPPAPAEPPPAIQRRLTLEDRLRPNLEKLVEIRRVYQREHNRLSGQVVAADGSPVSDAVVEAWIPNRRRFTERSADNGAYSLQLQARANHVYMRVSAAGYAPVPAEPVNGLVSIAANGPADGVQLVLEPESTLSGIVVDTNGTPVPDMPLYIMWSNDVLSDERAAVMDGQGGFSFDRLGAGEYSLAFRFFRNWYSPLSGRPYYVTLAPAEHKTGVRIVVPASVMQRYVSGIVVDHDGNVVDDAQIVQSPENTIAQTNELGEFRGVVRSFPATLQAIHPGYSTSLPQAIDSNRQGLHFALRAPATISGRVTDLKTGEPHHVFRVGRRRFETLDGRFENLPVPADRESIAVSVRGSPRTTVPFEPPLEIGEHRQVEVRVAPGRSFDGRVIDASGRPVRLARVSAYEPSRWGGRSDGTLDTTNDDGGFFLAGPFAYGSLDVFVEQARARPQRFTITVSPDMALAVLRLEAGSTLRVEVSGLAPSPHVQAGVVLFESDAVPDALDYVIYENPQNGVTGISPLQGGIAEFSGLRSGSYTAIVVVGSFGSGPSFSGSSLSTNTLEIPKNAQESVVLRVSL